MPDVPPLDDKDRADLIAYLDGELDDRAARELEAKLNRNPRIRAEAEALRRTWDLLDYLPRPEPSGAFTHRTLDGVSALKLPPARPSFRWGWKPWALGVGWAATVLVAGAAGYGGVRLLPRRQPPPPPVQSQDLDPQMLRDLRVLDNLHRYEHVDDAQFLNKLDDPDLFGDDAGG